MLIIYFDILVQGLVGGRTETPPPGDLWGLTENKICLEIKYLCLPDTDNRQLIV